MKGPRISDHALVRFLERAGGLDVQALRERISASLARGHTAASTLGLADYTLKADGLIYRIRDGVLVTVYEELDR